MGGGEGGGREGGEQGPGTGGTGPKKPLEQAAGPRPGEGMEGGGGRGGGLQWVGGHCFASFMLLAGVSQAFFRIASLPLLVFLGGGTLL